MVNIDKDIPIPDNLNGGARRGATWKKYPWTKLEVGDSFVIKERSLKSVGHSVTKMNRIKDPMKFVCREDIEGVRIWRIK